MISHTATFKTVSFCWLEDVQEDGSARITLAGFRALYRTKWIPTDEDAGTVEAPVAFVSRGGENWISVRAKFPGGGYLPGFSAGEGEEAVARRLAGEHMALMVAKDLYFRTTGRYL